MDARISYARAADGSSIAYSLLGAELLGAPRIVIISGLLLGPYQMQFEQPEPADFLKGLSRQAQVLVFDPVGLGLSSGEQSAWHPDEPDEVDAITEAVGWDSYGLLGAFLDAPRAIAHAARRGDCVGDLMLWCPITSIEMLQQTRQGAPILDLAELDAQLFLQTFAHAATGWAEPDLARWIAEMHSNAPGLDVGLYVRHLLDLNADAMLERLRARTLVAFRRDSAILDMDAARRTVERIKGAQLALIDGQSLIPFGESNERVVETALDFFGGGKARLPARSVDVEADPRSLAERLGLTARQIEVLRFLASGRTNREIALELDISVHTVDRHISTIYRRSGLRGRADATAYALRNGLI